MWRCVNKVFGYCAQQPQGETEERDLSYTGLSGRLVTSTYFTRTCPNDPKNCPYYRTFAQTYKKLLKQPIKAA